MKLIEKFKSDKGAINSTEMIMLIALSVFLVLGVYRLIIQPMIDTSTGIGAEIEKMNPATP